MANVGFDRVHHLISNSMFHGLHPPLRPCLSHGLRFSLSFGHDHLRSPLRSLEHSLGALIVLNLANQHFSRGIQF